MAVHSDSSTVFTLVHSATDAGVSNTLSPRAVFTRMDEENPVVT